MFNSNDERHYFYQVIMKGLTTCISSDSEVNSLLKLLYKKLFYLDNDVSFFKTREIIGLQKDIVNNNIVIREVYTNDLMLCNIFSFIQENIESDYNDEITELIRKIYYRLDKVIYPYLSNNESDAEFKYFVEIIYDESNQ